MVEVDRKEGASVDMADGIANGHPSSLGHIPSGRWTFDETVTAVFDDMLARSIPHITAMRDSVFRIAKPFILPQTYIVDLGCARGDAMAPFLKEFCASNLFLGTDTSAPMIAACQARFSDLLAGGVVEFRRSDLRHEYPDINASVVLCILTLMFTPIEHRVRILTQIYEHLVPGGAFIFVEKVLVGDAVLDRAFVDVYHEYKRSHGYSFGEIEAKRLALEGILVSVTSRWNRELLHAAGFKHVECFWRCLNFSGWLAVR